MNNIELIAIGILVVCFFVMTAYYFKGEHKIRRTIFGMISGIAALIPAAMLVGMLGRELAVNLFTVSVSAILGIPGVIFLCVMRFF